MTSGLQALLAGIIDYAGLFPPAKLPLHQAIHQYARYQHDPDGWMLGRFLCPAQQLPELAPFVSQLFSSRPPLVILTLGRGGKSVPDFLAGLHADVDAMTTFLIRHNERVRLEVYEVRVPDEILAAGSNAAVLKLLDRTAKTFEEASFSSLALYYEAAPGTAWRSSMAMLCIGLADQQRHQRNRRAGFKLRCGGLQATDFPSAEHVALAITACRDADVPLKFTAGLHHPIRHFDAGLQTYAHGFLNVFGAGVLAHARRLENVDQVRRLIEDENAGHFAFDEDGFRWRDSRATVAEIRAARECAVHTFGSCSFEEPLQDLRALGLLNGRNGKDHS